jgi:capsular polysaccharide biosynthesis protein
MEINQFYLLFKQKKSIFAMVLLVFLVIGAILTVIQPFKYESKSDLLIVKETNIAVDPYTSAKANEYLSNILAKVVSTNSFFDEVARSGSDIDFSYFPARADKKMKLWRETVSATALNDSGIVSVSVFHTDQDQAMLIANAVNNILITKNNQYIGEGDRVKIKVLNEPIVSRWPVKPNVAMNMAISALLGLILAAAYLFLFLEPQNAYLKTNKNGRIESILLPMENNFISRESEPAKPVMPKNLPFAAEPAPKPMAGAENISQTERELSYEEIIKRGDIRNIFGQSEERGE